MKTFFFLASLVVLLFACKKDKSNNDSKQRYLSKVFKDGVLEHEIFYTTDKKPVRHNYYGTNTGTSILSSFRLYEYNADKLLETMTEFSKTNSFINKYSIQYDGNKRPTRMDDLKDDNTLQYYHLFDYDAQGDLVKARTFNYNTSKQTVEANMTYSQHKLTKIIRRLYTNNPPTLYDSSTYSFNNKTLPASWNSFENFVFASLPNGDRTYMDMIIDSSFYYYVDAPPNTIRATFSQKQYNSEGFLSKQHFSYKYTSVLAPTTADYDRTYEYIE